jgi:hypothetical protein
MAGGLGATWAHRPAPQAGMKTEQKYFELTVFVFYIMNHFFNMKNCQF